MTAPRAVTTREVLDRMGEAWAELSRVVAPLLGALERAVAALDRFLRAAHEVLEVLPAALGAVSVLRAERDGDDPNVGEFGHKFTDQGEGFGETWGWLPSDCESCGRRYVGTLGCEAFPVRIPTEILTGDVSHRTPYPGDQGLQWIPKPAEPAP